MADEGRTMGTTNTLPPPLSSACESSHPVELWILVNGEIVQCAGTFLPADEKGRPQLTAALPEGFVGVMRTGAAVRGFFTDLDGSVHTFLSSIHDWAPFRDRPSAARVVLEVPSLVAPCQRRRGDRKHLNSPVVRLAVTIRGQREVVPGRLVDASHSGLGVRTIRSHRNWFGEATRVEVEVDLPGRSEPVVLPAVVARTQGEALHWLIGLRVEGTAAARKALAAILDSVL